MVRNVGWGGIKGKKWEWGGNKEMKLGMGVLKERNGGGGWG